MPLRECPHYITKTRKKQVILRVIQSIVYTIMYRAKQKLNRMNAKRRSQMAILGFISVSFVVGFAVGALIISLAAINKSVEVITQREDETELESH